MKESLWNACGISPKHFSKVVRFENAFRMKTKAPNLDWPSIAFRCGYYDYQHLVEGLQRAKVKPPTTFT